MVGRFVAPLAPTLGCVALVVACSSATPPSETSVADAAAWQEDAGKEDAGNAGKEDAGNATSIDAAGDSDGGPSDAGRTEDALALDGSIQCVPGWGDPLDGGALQPLSVQGNHLVRNGQPFEFYGVTRDTLEWGTDNWGGCGGDGHFTATDFAAIKSWRTTAVRIPLSEANWMGRACDATTYASLVDSAVTTANAAGLYAILDLHWTDVQGQAPCGSGCGSGQQPMPDPDSIAFWSQVAARYGKNPGVIFELFNEPHPNATNGVVEPADWACWRNGGCTVTSSTDSSVTYTAVGMQALYDAARAAAPNTVILVGGADWASDLSGVTTSYALSGSNIVYNVHVYTQDHHSVPDWDSHFGAVTTTYAVASTEYGTLDCSSGITASLLRYFQAPQGDPTRRMSWTVWGWSDPGSCAQPSLLADWTGTPLVDDSNADGEHAYQRSLGYGQATLIHDTLVAYDACGDVPVATDILSLGDSITYGVNEPLDASYPGDLGAALGPSYFVMNAGMPGDTVAASSGYPGMTARYATFATPGDYRWCVFLGGVNDIGRGATAAATFANASALLDTMRGNGCEPIVFELTPFAGAPYGYDNPTSEAQAVIYNQDLEAYCGDAGVTCLDTRALLGNGATPPAYLPQYDSGDHLHPSAAGYAAMAKLVEPSIP